VCASRRNQNDKVMYAIVEIAGQQFKVEQGKKIFVHRLDIEEGKEIDFDKVLLIEDEGNILIGDPTIKDAIIGAKIVDHPRGEKVIVFKKKRKKGYRVKNGHRQNLTQVEIISINGKGSAAEKPADAVKEKKPASKKAAPKESSVANEKKESEKKDKE
jgi:large subunit ribosomal protein L21